MAKSQQTFKKNELTKKRLKKNADKLIKKETRKDNNNKGKSLEEMFVYVDSLGRLTDVPPSEQQNDKKSSTTDFVEAKVNYYNSEKQFGFLVTKSNESIYFRTKDLGREAVVGEKYMITSKEGSKGLVVAEVLFM